MHYVRASDIIACRIGTSKEGLKNEHAAGIACGFGDGDDGFGRLQLFPSDYYRLRVVPIRVPPLRERPDDIPPLANHFLASFWARYRRKGTPVPSWTEAGLLALCSHPWRGNVR